MIKLLVHGHIPKWYGGKQVSGLSNAMFSLAEAISQRKNMDVFFNATDVKKTKIINDYFKVLGWNMMTAIASLLVNFRYLLRIWVKSKNLVGNTSFLSRLSLFGKRLIFR